MNILVSLKILETIFDKIRGVRGYLSDPGRWLDWYLVFLRIFRVSRIRYWLWMKLFTPWPRRYMLIMIECDDWGDNRVAPQVRLSLDQWFENASAAEEAFVRHAPLGDGTTRVWRINSISGNARWHQRIAVWITRQILKIGKRP